MVTEIYSPWVSEAENNKKLLQRLSEAVGHKVTRYSHLYEMGGFVAGLRMQTGLFSYLLFNTGSEIGKKGFISVETQKELIQARKFAEALEKEGYTVKIVKEWLDNTEKKVKE